LERRLFTPPFAASEPARPQPDWRWLHAELRRPGVTLLLAWEEYRAGQPDGYGYSRFCDLYAEWRGRLSPTMRQTHPAGERLFVDYAGQTIEVIDATTGEVHRAQIFVAALGASNFTYAEARWTQALPDWIGCHVNAFAKLGGVARQIVCDNLKAGVTAACRYEPGINRSYQDMATHYGTAVLPARVRRPRDKAKVEVAVQVVQRWVLARLRHQRFFSLVELNDAIRALMADLNNRPMRHLGTSRQALFETLERPALLKLPADPYVYAEWRRCRAGLDYHVELHGHFYSVPYRLMRETIEARITGPTGTGKTWLSCALGHRACCDNRSVLYQRVPRLLEGLALARGDGRYARMLKSLARVQLLILDDWAITPLTADQRRDIMEIIDDRHDRASTIVTSQVPVELWHEHIGNPTIADAVLDRLVHGAHRLELRGESIRKLRAAKTKLDEGAT
jgi:transposase